MIFFNSASSPLVLEHRHWNTLYFGFNERVYEEESSIQQSNLLLHLPAAPGPDHTQARVRVYYIGVDKHTGKPTQFKVQDTGYIINNRNVGYRIKDKGWKIPNTGYDTEYMIKARGLRIKNKRIKDKG